MVEIKQKLFFLNVWDNYELVMLVNEGILTYSEVLFQHFLEGVEERNGDK